MKRRRERGGGKRERRGGGGGRGREEWAGRGGKWAEEQSKQSIHCVVLAHGKSFVMPRTYLYAEKCFNNSNKTKQGKHILST